MKHFQLIPLSRTHFCVCSVHQADSRVSSLVGVSWPFAGSRTHPKVSSLGEPDGSSSRHLHLRQCKNAQLLILHARREQPSVLMFLSVCRLKKQTARSPSASWICWGPQTFDISLLYCGSSGECRSKHPVVHFDQINRILMFCSAHWILFHDNTNLKDKYFLSLQDSLFILILLLFAGFLWVWATLGYHSTCRVSTAAPS